MTFVGANIALDYNDDPAHYCFSSAEDLEVARDGGIKKNCLGFAPDGIFDPLGARKWA